MRGLAALALLLGAQEDGGWARIPPDTLCLGMSARMSE